MTYLTCIWLLVWWRAMQEWSIWMWSHQPEIRVSCHLSYHITSYFLTQWLQIYKNMNKKFMFVKFSICTELKGFSYFISFSEQWQIKKLYQSGYKLHRAYTIFTWYHCLPILDMWSWQQALIGPWPQTLLSILYSSASFVLILSINQLSPWQLVHTCHEMTYQKQVKPYFTFVIRLSEKNNQSI